MYHNYIGSSENILYLAYLFVSIFSIVALFWLFHFWSDYDNDNWIFIVLLTNDRVIFCLLSQIRGPVLLIEIS